MGRVAGAYALHRLERVGAKDPVSSLPGLEVCESCIPHFPTEGKYGHLSTCRQMAVDQPTWRIVDYSTIRFSSPYNYVCNGEAPVQAILRP